MEKRFEDGKILDKIDEEKRGFIKKVVIGTAFAVPLINSFSMNGLKIDLTAKMARATDYDKSGGYDEAGDSNSSDSYGGSGSRSGSGSSGSGSSGSGGTGPCCS